MERGPWAQSTQLKGKIEVDYLKIMDPTYALGLVKKLFYLKKKELGIF